MNKLVRKFVVLLISLGMGVYASYLLVAKGIKLPAGILFLGAVVFYCLLSPKDDADDNYITNPVYSDDPNNIFYDHSKH